MARPLSPAIAKWIEDNREKLDFEKRARLIARKRREDEARARLVPMEYTFIGPNTSCGPRRK